jgi:hypothetical protein
VIPIVVENVGIWGEAVVRFHLHVNGGAKIACITQSALEKAGSLLVVVVFTVRFAPDPVVVVATLVCAVTYPFPPFSKINPVTGPVAPPPLIEDTVAIPFNPLGM